MTYIFYSDRHRLNSDNVNYIYLIRRRLRVKILTEMLNILLKNEQS